MKYFASLASLIWVLLAVAPAQSQVHFTDCATRTGSNATIIIPSNIHSELGGRTIESGDEIAVFTGAGTCAGVATWTGANVALTAWGDDLYTEGMQGFEEGEPLRFQIWSAAEGREYGVVDSVAVDFSSERSYYRSTGSYESNAIYVIKSFVVLPPDGSGARGEAHSGPEADRDVEGSLGQDLLQNYPNPFQSTTTITYSLPRDEYVQVDVLDAQGRSVGVLLAAYQEAGDHELLFDGSNLPSGLYLYRLSAESFTEVRRMTLLR